MIPTKYRGSSCNRLVTPGLAVCVRGESSMRDGFTRLTPEQGFASLPDSILVLQSAPGADIGLARAIGDALVAAFERGPGTQTRVAATQ